MASNYFRTKPLSLIQQRIAIQQNYSGVIESISTDKNVLHCILNLQPSIESCMYKVKLSYRLADGFPKAWLISPALQKVNGKYPHHIYGFDEMQHPRLCVYYPGYREWRNNMSISETFIPWVITWLSTYEYWQITGVWFYDESPVPKKENSKQ